MDEKTSQNYKNKVRTNSIFFLQRRSEQRGGGQSGDQRDCRQPSSGSLTFSDQQRRQESHRSIFGAKN